MKTVHQTLSTFRGATLPTAPSKGVIHAVGEVFRQIGNKLGDGALGRMWDMPDDHEQAKRRRIEIRDEWAAAMSDFRPEEFARGLRAMDNLRFPPTLPELRRLCRPCLDPETAWWEAEHALRQRDLGEVGDWTHPAVFRAATQMATEVRSGDYPRHRVRWSIIMSRELAAGWGQDVPVREVDPEEASRRLGYTPPRPIPATAEALALKRMLHEEQRRARERQAAKEAHS